MKRTILLIAILFYSILHSQTFDGNLGSKSLNWTMEQKDFSSLPRIGIDPMSIKLWDNYNGANSPSQYGSLLEINGRVSHLVSQLYFVGTGADNDRIKYRTAFYAQNSWSEWRNILDSKNDVESRGNLKIEGNGYIAGKFSVGNNHGVKLSVENSGWINTSIIETGYTDALGDFTDIKVAGYISNSASVRILRNGNVGIGVIRPTNKLDVNGTIHSKEVKVDMDGWSWPDFVFKKEYTLPTLEEVEKHIADKGHLENIPSEEEVLKDGISLGEMNSKLLQKIEELTLYVIQQNRKIYSQEDKIKELEKEIIAFKSFSERLTKIEQQLK